MATEVKPMVGLHGPVALFWVMSSLIWQLVQSRFVFCTMLRLLSLIGKSGHNCCCHEVKVPSAATVIITDYHQSICVQAFMSMYISLLPKLRTQPFGVLSFCRKTFCPNHNRACALFVV